MAALSSAWETWRTLSPSESNVTAIPSALSCLAEAMASSTIIPATKRRDTLLPMEDFSAKARKAVLVESAIKSARNNPVSPLKSMLAHFRTKGVGWVFWWGDQNCNPNPGRCPGLGYGRAFGAKQIRARSRFPSGMTNEKSNYKNKQ